MNKFSPLTLLPSWRMRVCGPEANVLHHEPIQCPWQAQKEACKHHQQSEHSILQSLCSRTTNEERKDKDQKTKRMICFRHRIKRMRYVSLCAYLCKVRLQQIASIAMRKIRTDESQSSRGDIQSSCASQRWNHRSKCRGQRSKLLRQLVNRKP